MALTSPQPAKVVDLRDYLSVVRARKWTLLVVATLVLGAVTVLTLVQPKTYTAVATVQVLPLTNPLVSTPSSLSASQPDIATEAAVAGSTAVASIVSERLHGSVSPLDLVKRESAQPASAGNVLVISYSATDPQAAASIANAFANAYLEYRTRTATGPLETAITDARITVQHLSHELANVTSDSERTLVSTRMVSAQDLLRQYETALQLVTPGNVIEPASAATAVPSPHVVRNIAIGVAAGLVLGIVAAFLRSGLADREAGSAGVRARGDSAASHG